MLLCCLLDGWFCWLSMFSLNSDILLQCYAGLTIDIWPTLCLCTGSVLIYTFFFMCNFHYISGVKVIPY
jgi:hypothetical protein